MIRCPDSELHPDGEPATIVGCGQVIEDASPDSEGLVDCPHCGIWFHINEGAMRKEFEMNPEQLQALLEASKPVPYMVIGGSVAPSQRENANAAWDKLGTELGFDPTSVEPVAGKGIEFFTAEVIGEKAMYTEAEKEHIRAAITLFGKVSLRTLAPLIVLLEEALAANEAFIRENPEEPEKFPVSRQVSRVTVPALKATLRAVKVVDKAVREGTPRGKEHLEDLRKEVGLDPA